MGKSISIYVPDDLAEKMEKFKEVNWSEVARKGIEDYVEGRERRTQMLEKLEWQLRDMEALRRELVHKIRSVRIHETDKILIEPKTEMKIDWPPMVCIDFKIDNREYGSDVILDRLLYDLRLHVKGESVVKFSDAYLEKRVVLSKGEINFQRKISIQAEDCHRIHQMAQQEELDIIWEIQGKAFFEGPDGPFVVNINWRQETAFSHWKKWYKPWAERYTEHRSV